MQKLIDCVFRCALCAAAFFVGWAVLRIFVCDQFVVPSESMSPTLTAGDRILADKWVAGARIYKKLRFGKDVPLHSFRMPGVRSVRPNDVVVFNAPHGYDRKRIEFRINYVYTKRCIGAPGDTISICNGFFRNNRHAGSIGDLGRQRALSSTPDSLIPRNVLRAFPFDDRNFGWTIRNLGPLYVPRAGVRFELDSCSWKLYRQIVEYETGVSLSYKDGMFRLGDDTLSVYTFRGNYYFFCGDNVSDSKDSRYLGFVPEEFIIGVVRRISYSEEPYTGRKRPNRRWKRIE